MFVRPLPYLALSLHPRHRYECNETKNAIAAETCTTRKPTYYHLRRQSNVGLQIVLIHPHVVIMLNPYAPPNGPTPIPQIDRRTSDFSIWLLATSAIAGSTISAATLVAIHYLALDVARPLAAIGTIVIVIVIQFVTSVQVARQSKTNKIFVSQAINVLSWSAFLGVLSGAHFLLPKVPELRWRDMAVFGSFAFASALLCLLTCHFVKLRVAEKNADS